MFVTNSPGAEKFRSRINFACSTFSSLQSCLWSRRSEGMVYQAVVCSILLYEPARVVNERMLEVFDNSSISRIPYVRLRDCVRLRWFGYAARCPNGELIKDLLLPTPHRTWRRQTGGQLKTWTTAIKADLEIPRTQPRVFGHARWGKVWAKASSELAQDRWAWSASIRDVVNLIVDASPTHPGWMPTQVQSCVWME